MIHWQTKSKGIYSMKKEVKLTLIVKADIENREILSDLKTQIDKCKNLYEVVDYDISEVKDDKW